MITIEEYNELLEKLKESEKERVRLSRALRVCESRNSIFKLNVETQSTLNKTITHAKQRQEMYLRLLLESCPDIIFVFDEKMKFLLGTNSVSNIIDVSEVSILRGRELDAIVERYNPAAFTMEMIGIIKNIIEDHSNGNIVRKLEIAADGNKYSVNILSFYKENNEFVGVLVIMNDITEMIAAKELSEQASRSKGEFLSRMSHEMRTPMNAIIGMTKIAKDSKDLSKMEYCLDKIEIASKHLLGVINDILDMSKIEADKFEISFDKFDFEKMIMNTTNIINFPVEEKKQSLNINIDKNVPSLIIGDELRLTQVITNLLTNAVKFTHEGGTITLNARCLTDTTEETILQIEVIDNGIGIATEQQSRLFRFFEQADGGIARKFGGTGLGLAISKRIVEMMGGRIWIESEPDKGSKFIFTIKAGNGSTDNPNPESGKGGIHIPTDDTSHEIKDYFTNVSEAAAKEISDQDIHNYKGHVFLIAEDVEINREIMAAILSETETIIDFAQNGFEAVKMFKENPGRYSLILMDIHMPEMDGYRASGEIRSLSYPEARTIPIIAMTADVFREDIERCIQAGMNSHIGKPVDMGDLFIKIEQYLPQKVN